MAIQINDLLGMNTSLSKDYLYKAYKYCVERIRLDIVALPCIMDSQIVRLDKFNDMAYTYNGSEVAIKEIVGIEGVTPTNTKPDLTGVSVGNLIIGDVNHYEDTYGFDSFESVNAEHTTAPIIYRQGDEIICSNYDDITTPFFWLLCYVYPHYLNTEDGIYADTYSYDFSGDDPVGDWYACPMLSIIMCSKALALAHEGCGDIVEASKYNTLVSTYLNMYNRNTDTKYLSRLGIVGTLASNHLMEV